MTEKATPDKRWTDEEKRQWRREQEKLGDARARAAMAIACDYVNDEDADEEERAARRVGFRSFLKCNRQNKQAPLELLQRDDVLTLSGKWRCHSRWSCPRCSAAGMYSEAVNIRTMLEAIQKENEAREDGPRLSVLFLTLTAPHKPGEGLREQMHLFSETFSKVFHSSAVRKRRERYQMIGSVRCYDHTLTFRETREGLAPRLWPRDWHTHLHVLLIFDFTIEDNSEALADIEETIWAAWEKRVEAAYDDGRKPDKRAFRLEVVDLAGGMYDDPRALADYAAKVAALPGYLTKSQKARALGFELEDKDEYASLAPWDLLDKSQGLFAWRFDYAGAWVEYVEGTKGFHRVDWSKGLKERFGVLGLGAKVSARYTVPGEVADYVLKDSVFLSDVKELIAARDADGLAELLGAYELDETYARDMVVARKPWERKTDGQRVGERRKQARELNGEAEKAKDERAWRLLLDKKAREEAARQDFEEWRDAMTDKQWNDMQESSEE